MALRLLYVDDEEDLRTLVQCQLALAGHTVEVAPDGTSALATMERTPFDLVLLDLHMPVMDGAEVIRRMRARGISSAVILLTGDSPRDAGLQTRELGAAGYLTKPFHCSDLLAAIAAVPAGPPAS
jgi:two-component system alkaline phosphatase synthesis response regulator PhoP